MQAGLPLRGLLRPIKGEMKSEKRYFSQSRGDAEKSTEEIKIADNFAKAGIVIVFK